MRPSFCLVLHRVCLPTALLIFAALCVLSLIVSADPPPKAMRPYGTEALDTRRQLARIASSIQGALDPQTRVAVFCWAARRNASRKQFNLAMFRLDVSQSHSLAGITVGEWSL
eukprot:1854724-Pleurochrysis_carterae.AAC.1